MALITRSSSEADQQAEQTVTAISSA